MPNEQSQGPTPYIPQQQPQAPQPQTQQPAQQPKQPQQAGGLDPDAMNLTKSIRHYESGGDFTRKGQSGEYGAYQFLPGTWQKYSREAGVSVPLNQASPEQQNQVAYTKIKQWKDAGYNVGQIASMWNAGEGAPNAYLDKNFAGINKSGAGYNVSDYAKNVANLYQTMKQAGTFDMQQPMADSPAAKAQDPTKKDPGLTGIPIVDSLSNFLFPIAGDIKNDITGQSSKSLLQQGGDLGLSALPFIPGIGLGAEAGMGAKLLGGAALGYGAGALSNLSQGQDVGQAVSPNLGTVGGALTGGVANVVLSKLFAPFTKNLTQSGGVSAIEGNLGSEAKRWQGLRTSMDKMPNSGGDALSLIARTPGAVPAVENGVFDTTAGRQILFKQERALSQLRASALDKMGGVTPSLSGERAATLEGAGIEHNIPQSLQAKAQALIDTEFKDTPFEKAKGAELAQTIAGMKDNYGGDEINWRQLEKIKESFPYNSPISRAAKSMLEDASKQSQAGDLGDLNKLIQTHINARKVLSVQGLHGKTIKGGRLGNMLRGHTAAVVGGLAADALGGGFVGTIGSALGGEAVSKMLSKWMGETSFSNPVRDALMEHIVSEDPSVVQKFSQFAGQGGGAVAPQLQPNAPGATGGLLRKLLVTSAARAPAALQQ